MRRVPPARRIVDGTEPRPIPACAHVDGTWAARASVPTERGLRQSAPGPGRRNRWCMQPTCGPLKKNPSQALRLARDEGPVLVLKGNEPHALLVHLDESLTDTETGIRPALAASLYREGCVSLGKGRAGQRPVHKRFHRSPRQPGESTSFVRTKRHLTKPATSPRGCRHKRRRAVDRPWPRSISCSYRERSSPGSRPPPRSAWSVCRSREKTAGA